MNYISKDFSVQHLAYYRLLIQSNYGQDLIYVVDDNNTVQASFGFPEDQPSVEVTKILALPFTDVSILLPQTSVTFIPSEAYDPDQKKLYATYLTNRNDLDVQMVYIPNYQVMGVFQYDSIRWKRWKELFPEANFKPRFKRVFDLTLSEEQTSGSHVNVHIDGNQADILLIVDNQFKFYNTFHVQTAEDLCYYILKVSQNFGIKRLDVIHVSGLASDHPFVTTLYPFAEKISLYHSNGSLLSPHFILDDSICV